MHGRQLGALMNRVGSGIPVRNNRPTIAVSGPPVCLITGITVYCVKGGGSVGIHIVRPLTKLPGEIHLDKS